MDKSLMFFKQKNFLLLSIVIIIVSVLLRIYQVGDRCLWFDEAKTADFSSISIEDTLDKTRSRSSAPIIHPIILYFTQQIGDGPWAVRFISVFASICVIVVMLMMVRVGISHTTAIIAALLLAMSASQLRYALEVREYSLSVLCSAMLLYAYLNYVNSKRKNGPLILLCSLLFVAPFVQYGLVFICFAIIIGVCLFPSALGEETGHSKIQHSIIAAVMLGIGGGLSYILTLRYQLYIVGMQIERGHYYIYTEQNFLKFIIKSTYNFVIFVLPGQAIIGLVVVSIVYSANKLFVHRSFDPLILLGLVSISMLIISSVVHVYPYGGIRQCLFLAPLVSLIVAKGLDDFIQNTVESSRRLSILALSLSVIIAGGIDINHRKPYRSQEELLKIYNHLSQSIVSGDQVYIYCGARAALKFYGLDDKNYIYGSCFRKKSEKYVMELQHKLKEETQRLWLIFSHIYKNEEELILAGLSNKWDELEKIKRRGATICLLKKNKNNNIR